MSSWWEARENCPFTSSGRALAAVGSQYDQSKPGSAAFSFSSHSQLEECSRAQLEAETVYYCSFTKDREAFEVQFDEHGLLHQGQAGAWDLVETGPDGWIFVLRDGLVYAHEKKTDQPPR